MASCFSCVEMGPPIEVFALNKSFLEDKHPHKVNLGVGGKVTMMTGVMRKCVWILCVVGRNFNLVDLRVGKCHCLDLNPCRFYGCLVMEMDNQCSNLGGVCLSH